VLSYNYYKADNIKVNIENSIATITPDKDFEGIAYLFFIANDSYETTVSNVFSINMNNASTSKESKAINKEFQEQINETRIVINKPVKWLKKVKLDELKSNVSINITPFATNITVKKIINEIIEVIPDEKIKIRDKGIIKGLKEYELEKEIEKAEKEKNKETDPEKIREKEEKIRELQQEKDELTTNKIPSSLLSITGNVVKEEIEIIKEINEENKEVAEEKEETSENKISSFITSITGNVVSDQQDKITEIEDKIEVLVGKIENLEENNKVLEEKNRALEIEVELLKIIVYRLSQLEEDKLTDILPPLPEIITFTEDINQTKIIIEDLVQEIEIEYYTEGPTSEEITLADNKKQIIISSDIHYENILASTTLPIEANSEAVKLYWIINESKIEVDIDKYDTNENNLVDYIEWNVPSLSNQTYELEITILNVQSRPTLFGNWTVEFNTTGTGNLTISTSDGTTYSELYDDSLSTLDDLSILELACDNNILFNYYDKVNDDNIYLININNEKIRLDETLNKNEIIKSLYVENYNCSGLGYWTVKVITSGVHTQQFNFSNQIAYAFNTVASDVCDQSSATECNITTSHTVADDWSQTSLATVLNA